MAISRGPKIVTNGLILALDAGDNNSYSSVEVLIVAGGGSGGVDNGGGGGGGGVIYAGFTPVLNNAYSVVVGAGGAARSGASDDGPGNNGSSSSVFGYTAIGGSGGTGWVNPGLPPGSASYTGGSGGGQSASTGGVNSVGAGTATSGQGYPGGTAVAAYAGGGGGAGGAGGNATAGSVGAGGEGFYVGDLFGSLAGVGGYVAGGGAGGFDYVTGSRSTLPFTRNGTTKKLTETGEDACPNNTGAGGNGANHDNENSGAGGSGVVFVRYFGPQRATGGTIYTFNGYTIHQFNSAGTFTLTTDVVWNDTSGNNNNGTLNYSPTYSNQNRGSLVFNGSNNFVSISSLASFNFSSTMSVFVWHKNIGGDYRGVIANTYGGGGFDLRYGRENFFGGGNNGTILNVSINTSSGTFSRSINAELNVWGNYGFTYNGSSLIAYKNGVSFSTISASGSVSITSNPVIIGRNLVGSEFLSGNVAKASIYNRALTASEVLQNYNATKSRFGL